MTHTPGPWTRETLTTKAGRNKVAITGKARRVCDVSVDDDEQDANSRLIAAAPDLLAALAQIVENNPPRGVTFKQWVRTTARAAIAAAEGR